MIKKPTKRALAGIRPGTLTGAAFSAARKAALKGLHSHGCSQCRAYYTDACSDPLVNGQCKGCQGLPHGRPSWDRDRDPIDCCLTGSAPATARQLVAFRLAGDGLWWICAECSRTSPYNPSTIPEEHPTGGQP